MIDQPPTTAIRAALDTRAAEIATANTWTYADRINTRGDSRRLRATLVFTGDSPGRECDRAGTCKAVRVAFEWDVEATAERCSPGVYAISTPLESETCPGTVSSMSWTWRAADRWTP